jgi:hypothetical protein
MYTSNKLAKTWEVTNDKQFQFAHTFSQDLD